MVLNIDSNIANPLTHLVKTSYYHSGDYTRLDTILRTILYRRNISGKPTISFYSLPEFKEWKDQQANLKQWDIKYYKGFYFWSLHVSKFICIAAQHFNLAIQHFVDWFHCKIWTIIFVLKCVYIVWCHLLLNTGLGTSTGSEAKEYFSDMARHKIRFR